MKNKKYIFIGLGNKNNAIKEMFYEVINGKIPNANYVEPFVFPNKFVEKVHRFVYSQKLRRFFKWIPKKFWEKFHIVNKIEFNKSEITYLIFTYGTDIQRLCFPRLLKKIKQKYGDNVKLVLMLFDSIDSPLKKQGWDKILDIRKYFDIVTTFDKEDAKKYDMIHFNDPYAKRDIVEDKKLKHSDVFFVGSDKGRGEILNKIANRMQKEGISFDFRVIGLQKKYEIGGLIRQNTYLTYDNTIKCILASDCLLEVLCEGQHSASLRYYEAVVYGKKLLTNNPEVKKLKYYNPKFIQYFDNVDSIDMDWIKDCTTVNYKYNGDFSIKTFLEKITK